MFRATSLIEDSDQKQPKCLSTDDWMKKGSMSIYYNTTYQLKKIKY